MKRSDLQKLIEVGCCKRCIHYEPWTKDMCKYEKLKTFYEVCKNFEVKNG